MKKIWSSFTINLHKSVEKVLFMLNFCYFVYVILCMYFAEHNHGYPTLLTSSSIHYIQVHAGCITRMKPQLRGKVPVHFLYISNGSTVRADKS